MNVVLSEILNPLPQLGPGRAVVQAQGEVVAVQAQSEVVAIQAQGEVVAVQAQGEVVAVLVVQLWEGM